MYCLLHDTDPVLNCGDEWCYPCSVESEGILYVSLTALIDPVRCAVLLKIPVESLS